MTNVGQTIITARGPDEDIARLRDEIEATVIGGRTFSIARLTRGDAALERYVLWSDIIEEAEPICLSVGIIHDLDCLYLAEDLAARFPSLTVTGWFSAEGSIPDVRILSFRGTTQVYDVVFDGPWFSLPAPGGRGDRFAVCFYQRSPEAALAAAEHHRDDGLRRIAAEAPRHADWHRGDDGYGEGFFFRPPRAGDDGAAVLLYGGPLTWLHAVDLTGGYGRAEEISLEQLAARAPDLVAPVEHWLRVEAWRQAAFQAALATPPADDEIVF